MQSWIIIATAQEHIGLNIRYSKGYKIKFKYYTIALIYEICQKSSIVFVPKLEYNFEKSEYGV